MSHYNVSFYTDDSALVIRLASAFRESGHRLHFARGQDELLVPVFLKYIDVLLIDERMAEIDTWNITNLVRQFAGTDREIAIFGLVDKLDSALIARSSECGVDAFLLKSAIGDQLVPRIRPLSGKLPVRDVEEPEWSPFKEQGAFLVALRDKLDIYELEEAMPRDRRRDPTAKHVSSNGVTVSLSWRDRPPNTSRLEVARTNVVPEHTPISNRQPAMMPNLIGKTFGKVLIQQEIGKGGGGRVYAGRHTSLDMLVAVKVLYPDLVQRDSNFANRFLEEARTAAKIKSSSVVRVFDCDRNPETGCYYIVMEYIEGNSLEDEIKQVGAVGEFRLTEIALDVTRCLTQAESLGIIHRDIKPANIMITSEGEVKLADLGLAKVVDSAVGIATGKLQDARIPESTESIVGTPYYIAPEQIEGHATIDSRADIYSLGATLFHAAWGQRPFETTSVYDLFYNHLNTPPPKLSDLTKEVSPSFSRIVDRMLAKKPKGRYSSCRELNGVIRDHYFWLIRNMKTTRSGGLFSTITGRIKRRG